MCGQQTEIEFPCEWTYTLIGLGSEEVKQAVNEIFKSKSVTLSPSKKSRTGKYISMYAHAHVVSREQRDQLFEQLKEHDAIKMVL